MLTGAVLALLLPAGFAASSLTAALRDWLAAAHVLPTDPGGLGRSLTALMLGTGGALSLVLGILVVAAVAAPIVQHGLLLTAETLRPKLERISPIAGAKRLFSPRALLEFTKSILKVTLVGVAAAAVLWSARGRLIGATDLAVGAYPGLLAEQGVRLFGIAAVLAALVAGLDFAYQRFDHRRRLRMTRREVQDEVKQSEGDPLVRQRLRGLRMERARRRMMADVPESTVVITNPTHVAVALKYESASMAAPVLMAKGVDAVALRIRAVAAEHGVPIVENPPLARALGRAVEIGSEIPPEHYRATAEVISYVMRMGKRP